MSTSHTESTADMADRHRQFFALAMLGAGLIYLVKAIESMVPAPADTYLDYATMGLALCTIGILLPAFIAKSRLPRGERLVYFSEDGYAAQLLRRSFKISWSVTFISFVVLEVVARKIGDGLPGTFHIQTGLFIMLGTLSVSFLLLNWGAGQDSTGQDSTEEIT